MFKVKLIATLLFAVLIGFSMSFAFAQYGMPDIPQMTEVKGEYRDDATGVTITFPSGWSGIEMETSQGRLATVAPGGMTSGQPTQAMNLIISDKTKVKEAPSDPTQGKSDCSVDSTKSVTVSRAVALETVLTCTDDYGNVTKAKIISSQTEKNWITLMVVSPEGKFADASDKFDYSVKTLDIPSVIPTGQPTAAPEMKSNTAQLMVAGKSVIVPIQSSTSITDLAIDEEKKTVSFTADSMNDGTTLIGIGNVLKGPYAVMIDGQQAEDYTMQDENTMKFSFLAGSHDVSITGAQVVPEFPAGIMVVIILVIAVVTILSRTKILANFRY